MNVLLDTHLFLWWQADDAKLPPAARKLLIDPANVIFFSAASAWEMAIKKALGKLFVPDSLDQTLKDNHFQLLSISVAHAGRAGHLPRHHEDPFDRLLIAQAELEGLTLLTHDRTLSPYGRFIKVV